MYTVYKRLLTVCVSTSQIFLRSNFFHSKLNFDIYYMLRVTILRARVLLLRLQTQALLNRYTP